MYNKNQSTKYNKILILKRVFENNKNLILIIK